MSLITLINLQEKNCLSEEALRNGTWVKLICGASNQDLPSIADLCAIYASAGVHCIDLAADSAVVFAARQALDWVEAKQGYRPWLMISLSDGRDLHFRKAWFDQNKCPKDCPRPCEKICPAKAISSKNGVHSDRCYGCGRCIPICPLGLIDEKDLNINCKNIAPLVSDLNPDAIEIHTAPGRIKVFEETLEELINSKTHFKRVAVSCGLNGDKTTIESLAQELWERYKCLHKYNLKPIWQLDGRPMSGDLGISSAKAAVNLWQQIKTIAPPGPLQLAGGTNQYTIKYLPEYSHPAGIAFGGMARKIIQPWLLEAQLQGISLREWPEGWDAALRRAKALINPWLKKFSKPKTFN